MYSPQLERKLMDVLNRSNDHLHDLVDALEAYCEQKGCDPSDIEVKNAMWSADNRLVIELEVDR
jgi:hypothetical protein